MAETACRLVSEFWRSGRQPCPQESQQERGGRFVGSPRDGHRMRRNWHDTDRSPAVAPCRPLQAVRFGRPTRAPQWRQLLPASCWPSGDAMSDRPVQLSGLFHGTVSQTDLAADAGGRPDSLSAAQMPCSAARATTPIINVRTAPCMGDNLESRYKGEHRPDFWAELFSSEAGPPLRKNAWQVA